jgi:hypothetical protein
MEKITFDEKTVIYKTKFLTKFKDEILAECVDILKLDLKNPLDAYNIDIMIDDSGKIIIQNRLHEIIQFGIDCCMELTQNNNIAYSKIFNTNSINIMRTKPRQFDPLRTSKYDYPELLNYHTHDNPPYLYKGNLINNTPIPEYVFVYYIQMPDNLNDNDAILAVEGQDGTQYSILPEEGDLIVFSSSLPHAPYPAFNSSKDRIILGGSFGFLV